ncbi:lactate utilization protein C [Zobellella taiwanensis]|jgi:L-lactate dehydrogenase complex protein LldG|uniref:Lactate utilization protein C n=1 Tax=Zobellella taiwanensis TaxID=347535 RepID=A0A2P7QTJ4_9GAMM|nr:lactate utilization protein C [Zobellella taiwanensis]PSJ41292.1 lactate utilization protein C [Zobellella taiwanensis]
MSNARHAILDRLRQAKAKPLPVNDPDYPIWNQSGQAEMLARLTELLEQNHAEVRRLPRAELVATLKTHVEQAALKRVATGTGGDFFGEISQALADTAEQVLFDRPLEAWKDELFNRVDAGITGCHGAIAATGSLVLWPGPAEPRTLSLVPPRHIAILKASTLYPNLPAMMAAQGWHQAMPTNLLLVSGPSKTADIQQTLAYGAHGPKELLVLILEDA